MKNSELLVAVVCTPVAFFVGVLTARVFPEGLGVEWGTVADWGVAAGSIATALVALTAYRKWGDQVVAASRHKVALKIAEAAYELRDNFHYARQVEIDDWEIPTPVPSEQKDLHAAVYSARMRIVIDRGKDLNALRYKARAILWHDPIADNMTALVKQVRKLGADFRLRIEQVQLGHTPTDNASVDCARKVEELFKTLNDSLEEFFPDRQSKSRSRGSN